MAKDQKGGKMVKAEETELTVFGKTLTVSAARVEYNGLRKQCMKLAAGKYAAAKAALDREAWDPDQFCEEGEEWAASYIDAVADVAVNHLVSRGCYDIDRETYADNELDYSNWHDCFEAYCKQIGRINEEESSREEARQARSYAAKNKWVGFNDEGCKEADWRNMTGGLLQGAKNMIGRAVYQQVNAEKKAEIFERFKGRFALAIRRTIEDAAAGIINCLDDHGHPMDGAFVLQKEGEKAARIFKNLQSGNLPKEAEEDVKFQILTLNPYLRDFYGFIYEKEGDESGELEKVAGFFGISLDEQKYAAFESRLGSCPSNSVEKLKGYRKRVIELAEKYRVDPSEKIREVDYSINKLESKARTAFGMEYTSLEAAQAALEDPDSFREGVLTALVGVRQEGFLVQSAIPEKKIKNAHARFPIPDDEEILAFVDTTVMESGKSGLAITEWGIRWRNDFTTPTTISKYSWKELAQLRTNPVMAGKDEISFGDGAVYSNAGSASDCKVILRLILKLREFCRSAQFDLSELGREVSDQDEAQPIPESQEKEEKVVERHDDVPANDADTLSANAGTLALYWHCLKHSFTDKGRASRREYWTFFLINLIVNVLMVAFICVQQAKVDLTTLGFFGYSLILIIYPTMRRLHDIDRDSNWCWLALTGVGAFVLLGFLLTPGTEGPNRYGPSPTSGCARRSPSCENGSSGLLLASWWHSFDWHSAESMKLYWSRFGLHLLALGLLAALALKNDLVGAVFLYYLASLIPMLADSRRASVTAKRGWLTIPLVLLYMFLGFMVLGCLAHAEEERAAAADDDEYAEILKEVELEENAVQQKQPVEADGISGEDRSEHEKNLTKAECGIAPSQYEVGRDFLEGRGVKQDYKEALKWFKRAADQGNPQAQLSLARMYYEEQGIDDDTIDNGISSNKVIAAQLSKLAADQGLADAQVLLGEIYDFGIAGEERPEEAVRLFRLAAEQGNTKAQLCLGNMYMEGRGVAKDCKEAVRLIRTSAENYNREAQYKLGAMLYKGEVVERNFEEAAGWFRRVAYSDDADKKTRTKAQFQLGWMSTDGEGVEKNLSDACKWFEMAAENGDSDAQFNLGALYTKGGEGLTPDRAKAKKWFEKAAAQGDEKAKAALKRYYSTGE